MARDTYAGEDIISLEDITDRVEELRDEIEYAEVPDNEIGGPNDTVTDERQELATLESLLSELKGYGGNHKWEGDWYPDILISDSSFTEYAQGLVEDIGDLPRNLPSYIEIDWEATAKNLKVDYSTVEYDGVTYLYR